MTAAVDLSLGPRPLALRWLSSALWRVEHAFERARAEGQAEDAKLRIFFVTAIFAAAFITLGVGATRAALFSGLGGDNAPLALPMGARADLVDRNGQLLAVDLPYYAMFVDRREIWDTDETRRRLDPLLPIIARARLEKALGLKKRVQIVTPLSAQEKAHISDMGLPGVSFEPEERRSYPLGDTAAHLVGYAGAGGVGLSGSELALDKQLRAQAGRRPVALAMDLRVQAALDDEVARTASEHGAFGAVGLVTNIRTGEILAMSSWPAAPPERLAETERANTDRVANSVFEMGSTFKVFSVAMGLDSGVARLDSTFSTAPLVLPGQTINDYHAGKPVLSLSEVFTHSSNIGTGRLALQAGADNLTTYFKRFGLFTAAPVELKDSAHPLLPRKWNDNIVATTSFGHSISVTPMMMAAGYGAIMNGGRYVPLTILKRDAPPTAGTRQVVKPETSRIMLDLMRANVVEGSGKSAEAAAPGYRIGGKTGTADKVGPNGGYHSGQLISSFAAIFPTDGPLGIDRYFVMVLVDEPHANATDPRRPIGGVAAAPYVGRVVNRIAPFLGVARASTPLPIAAPAPTAATPADEDEH